MPTRPVELYDKITVLAPESPLLIRFASAFSSVPSQPSSPSSDEAVSSDVAFTSAETPSVYESQGEESPQDAKIERPAKLTDREGRTHQDLGMAYKDMGLVDEAIEEFRLALQAAD